MLLEGARRVGKSTIAENFAKNEYKSYILIDFSKTTSNILECFDDIGNLNIFCLRLQAETGITLYEHESLIIFDEVQLFPKARQATNRKLMWDLRIYMPVGGMPQAVEAYVNGKNFSEIDMIKRQMCLFVTK